jgi:predicted transposase/invertase (TIGR01784 family)
LKTDSIFYRIFQSLPSTFFELINQPASLADAYQFSSVEVKQLAFRIDGVFLPNTSELPIYFAEVQFQPDKKLYSRLFAEIFNYLDKTELTNNWRGVVIFPNRSVDTGATERYTELLNSPRVIRIYLDELTTIEASSIGISTVKLIIEPESTATTKAVERSTTNHRCRPTARNYTINRDDINLQIAALEPGGDGKNVWIK